MSLPNFLFRFHFTARLSTKFATFIRDFNVTRHGIAQLVQRRATGWRARIRFLAKFKRFSLSSTASTRVLGLSKPPLCTEGSIPGIKRPERESDKLLPSSSEANIDGAMYLFPHMPLWHKKKLKSPMCLTKQAISHMAVA
jgi:hypothetical protein